MRKKVPVHIITGFLGSGKTSFLNHFIKSLLPERIFVIENECGSTNVDGALVMEGVKELVELSAGCLCCSLADGFLDILQEASKRINEYDRIVIETTGIADPSSIIQVFLDNAAVERVFELKQTVGLVDVGLVEEWLQEKDEALRQIALSDVLLVNKVDTVQSDKVSQVCQLLKSINPQASIWSGSNGIFSVGKILEIGTIKPTTVERLENVHHHQHSHAAEGGNKHKITTFTIDFPRPLDLNNLQLDLNRIVHLYREQVYRVKGFIAITNYPNRVILQSARSAIIATDGTPWEDGRKREGKRVFIGKGLERKAFERMFNRHMVNA